MDESRRLAMRRAHTKHRDFCTCGMTVCGNGGKYIHAEMHERRKDGHHAVTSRVWHLMFPEHDGRKARAPALTFEQALEVRVGGPGDTACYSRTGKACEGFVGSGCLHCGRIIGAKAV